MDKNTKTYISPKVVKYYADYSSKLQQPEKTIYELLKPQLKQMKMLDIGVGGGRTTTFFAPEVKEYIGVDFSEGMINVCKEKFKASIPSAKFEICDVRNLTKYKTGYFDLVFFSFNGLDNINHEERNQALKEMRRICSNEGYLCFSSHNLQCLPDFFKIRFRLHPVKFLKSLISRKNLIEQNKEQITKISTAAHLSIFDDVYDFGLHTYYIRPSFQIQQLKQAGFNNIRLFNLDKGEELTQQIQFDSSTDSWIYYLCK